MTQERFNSLDEIQAARSGLKSFVKSDFQAKLKLELLKEPSSLLSDNTNFLLLFNLMLLNKPHELKEKLEMQPELVASSETKALKILNLLNLGEKISRTMVFPFESRDLVIHKKLASELAAMIVFIFFEIKKSTNLFSKSSIDLWDLIEVIPETFYYLAKKLLIDDQEEEFAKIKETIRTLENEEDSSNDVFELNELKELEKIKVQYLRILLGTRESSKPEDLDKLLVDYHAAYKPDLETRSKLIPKGIETFYCPKQVLENWTEILNEANAIQKEIESLANILNSTCEYFSCSDCCSYTFPTMSHTEYLYLKEWMSENGLDENLIKEKSKKIQKDYEEKFGERLGIIDKAKVGNQIRGIENPHNYKFSCPFLNEENKCSCHPARPLLCRGFGTATNNGLSIKTCNYYLKQYQHNSSPENERFVFDMRPMEMLIKSSDKHLYKEGLSDKEQPSGTIVAWFSQPEKPL